MKLWKNGPDSGVRLVTFPHLFWIVIVPHERSFLLEASQRSMKSPLGKTFMFFLLDRILAKVITLLGCILSLT